MIAQRFCVTFSLQARISAVLLGLGWACDIWLSQYLKAM
jgi:hypothetical protein